MIKEINQSKQRMRGRDIYSDKLEFEEELQVDPFSTDLRLFSIDLGMADEILNVCKILNQQKRLSIMFPDSDYIKIEYGLTMGNAALDFSKFRMVYAMGHILKECALLIGGISMMNHPRL